MPPEKPLPNLLEEHDLPRGLFPQNITNYKFDERTTRITVSMPQAYQAGDEYSGLRFSSTVTGVLEKEKLLHINEMQMKGGATWENVTRIKVRKTKKRKELRFHELML